jgi:hypothetical protein
MKILFILALAIGIISCNSRETKVDKTTLLGDDYRLFQDTPAWELAKAVQDEDEEKITEILSKDPKLINIQEPRFGTTLLIKTIVNQQFKPFEILLKNKADVHIHATYEGSTALIYACDSKYYDIKFAETLLKYGANVDDVQTDIEKQGKTRTPLMVACRTGVLELVELLVKNGANVNYQNGFKQSALSMSSIQNKYSIVLYLLRNGVDYTLPISYNVEQNKTYYLVDELRFFMPELESEEYKEKLEIIAFLKGKGIDYAKVPIPEYVIKEAKEKYPKDWEEYLKKY